MIKMKNTILFLALFCFINTPNWAQDRTSTIIPPSPNASSLGQYSDVPVSNYTGVPDISIPLFEIKSGKIDLPIKISYHSSGIRVNEDASWVGLGWSLHAGGVITRQVRGSDDFAHTGYIRNSLPPEEYFSTGQSDPKIDDLYSRINSPDKSLRVDAEPDIFFYNFLGYSGKFVFKFQTINNNIVTATSIDQNNLSFSYNIETHQWIVIDGNGWKYYLGTNELHAVEKTTDYTYAINTPIPIDDPTTYQEVVNRRINQYAQNTEEVDTAWYLTKVLTPEGEKIDFIYDNTNFGTLSTLTYSETLQQGSSDFLILEGPNSPSNIDWPPLDNNYVFQQQLIKDIYLKKIEFNNGYILFNTEDRQDLRRLNDSFRKPQRLKEAELFDLSGKSLKKIIFSQSYFNAEYVLSNSANAEDLLRSKLDSIQETYINKNTMLYEKKPAYIFTYNSIPLPDKLSFSIDHWGYYNGRDNNNIQVNKYNFYNTAIQGGIGLDQRDYSFIHPKKMLCPENMTNGRYFMGANREPNKDTMPAAILEQIKYPTGASVHFQYEPNYYSNGISYKKNNVGYSAYVDANGSINPDNESIQSFTLTEPVLFFVDFSLDKSTANINNQSDCKGYAALETENGNPILYLTPTINFDSNGVFHASASTNLQPGNYRLKVNNVEDKSLSISITGTYTESALIPEYNDLIGAGLRIKTITTYEGQEILKQKKFLYKHNGESTGRLMSPIKYYYFDSALKQTYSGISSGASTIIAELNTIINRKSQSVVPLGYSAQGSIIGYDRVYVSDVDQNGNNLGSHSYEYKNYNELAEEYFIPGVPNIINLSNGQLLKEEIFSNTGKLVNEKFYDYSLGSIEIIKGIIRYVNPLLINPTFKVIGDIRYYRINSEWWYPKSIIENNYDKNGQYPISTVINYEYENSLHKNLTKLTTLNSKGNIVVKTNKYPQDLISGIDETTATIISGMINKNIINPVIQSETIIGGNLVQSTINNFKNISFIDENNSSQNMYLPKNVKFSKDGSVNNYYKKTEFLNYGKYGNLTESEGEDGTITVYIWGYKDEYLVARIENANLFTVESVLTTSELSSLRNTASDQNTIATILNKIRIELPNAMVTTYTHIPLVGVSSITDPKGDTVNYSYDVLGRLQYVKDAQGKLLTDYQYHYKN